MKKYTVILLIVLILISLGATAYIIISNIQHSNRISKQNTTDTEKIKSTPIMSELKDDWIYTNEHSTSQIAGASAVNRASKTSFSASDSAEAASSLGFSTGGAKDINNFRENIKEGYFPISTDITYNGIFYDYFFETNNTEPESNNLFYPSYSLAYSNDPISNKMEYYMTVGLNSNIKESDFERKKLNLVVTLDISGSMSSGFDSYYYDFKTEQEDENDRKSKMTIANEALNALIEQLKPDDKLGIVLFDHEGYLAKPLNLIEDTDIEAIKRHVLEIEPSGGTNFEAGYKKATELFENNEQINADEYENRIIVITDAMPNEGITAKEDILEMVKNNSEKNIYTTFIGVGVDFNTDVTEKILDSKGANYYSVHSSEEFMKRMGEEFEFMVTPLVFDLDLDINSTDFEVEQVYGSDTQNNKDGNIVHINTLFPSKSDDNGEVKGGVILVKLKKISEGASGDISINVSYKDRAGKDFTDQKSVKINSNVTEELYDNTGIRKAIVLTRYVNTIKNWILYERSEDEKFAIMPITGIIDCNYKLNDILVLLGENERPSQELKISEKYRNTFKTLKEYILKENETIKDETLNKEIEILDLLIKQKGEIDEEKN